jgi:glycerophosphoryl diester phosphodiesterase
LSPDWLTRYIYAHRGWHGEGRVENSWSACKAAAEAGLGIELDVQETADGQAIVFHDATLERLTASTGPVRARGEVELTQIGFREGRETLCRLGEVLVIVAGRVPVLIEAKSEKNRSPVGLCRAIARALNWYGGPCAVMSFDPRVPRWFRRHAPQVVRGLVVSEKDSGRLRRRLGLWAARPQFLAYDVRDLPSPFAAAQRARGLPLLTWTVSDKARLATARAFADAPIAEAEGLEEALRKP